AGGMGAVYLAEQSTPKRQAAIKVLHKSAVVEDPTLVERFKREARAALSLSHPVIVNVYDFGELEDATLFLAMELVDGVSLTEKLREAPLDPKWCADVVAQMAEGLSEAHDKSIIHRDLKPDNVFVTEVRGHTLPKILDFGVAKLTDEVDLTKTGLIYGTPKYMSPEQIRGEKLDGRSDQYSLGIILYQMLVGEVPIKSETPIGYIIAHQNDIPVPPSELRPDLELPAGLEQTVLRMLEKERDRRFPSMRALRDALVAIRDGRAPSGLDAPAAGGRGAKVSASGSVGGNTRAAESEIGSGRLMKLLVIGILILGIAFLLLKYLL
ncbi:MAG: serine/threonine protein kinase, partial [Myxococcales bacterium]|nr:serine/threonine protein kinase [Myxococcales bacterium]